MSRRIPKIARGILKATAVLVGLVVVLVAVIAITGWYLSHDDYEYTWDHSIENIYGRAGDRFHNDGKHRGVALKGLGAPDFQPVANSNCH